MATTSALEAAIVEHDTIPFNGTEYIEFLVGNALQSFVFYLAAFGFQLVG